MSAKLPIIKEPHPQPLPAGGEGRQSTALAGWGSSGLISDQADMISNPKGFFFLCMKPPCLPKSGEGRQSVALAGWGSSGLISNQANMIQPFLYADEYIACVFFMKKKIYPNVYFRIILGIINPGSMINRKIWLPEISRNF